MKLNIYYSNSVDNCTQEMISTIEPNNLSEKNIIITPDRRTLLTEQELFAFSNTKSFFNVDVTTFTRFTHQTLKDSEYENKKLLTKPLAVSIIKKILLENKESLKSFKKSVKFNGIANKVFETLSMFKSCNISYYDIDTNTKNVALNNKLHDLQLVYEKYEEYLQTEYTDSFNRLTALSMVIDKKDFKNTNFYFVGFDDFTPQTYEIIHKLIKRAKSVSVSCSANFESINNKHIFLNNIYLYLMSLSEIIGIKPNIIKCTHKYKQDVTTLSENLFAYKTNTTQIDYNNLNVNVVSFENKQNEVEFVAKTILNNVFSLGTRFSDYTIIAPNLNSYKDILINEFNQQKINFYIDENKKYNEHVIVRVLLSLIDIHNTNSHPDSIFAFLKLLLPNKENAVFAYENYINYTGQRGIEILTRSQHYSNVDYEEFDEVYKELENVLIFLKNSNKTQTVESFINNLKNFMQDINLSEFADNLLNKYLENNEAVNFRITTQVLEKLEKAFDELNDVLGDYECDLSVFFSILETYLENITLSLPPIELDTVFVADSVSSFVSSNHTIFVLGANEGVLPVQLDDLGIISDKDISLLSQKNKLSPTVKFINKKNRALLYEKLLKYNNQLFVSYLTSNDKGEELMPSVFVNNIKQAFSITNLPNEIENPLNLNGEVLLNKGGEYEALDGLFKDRFVFNNPSVNYASKNLIKHLKNWSFNSGNSNYKEQLSVLNDSVTRHNSKAEEFVDNLFYRNKYENIKNANKLFFEKGTTNVSQFETYFSCPFKHFVRYGLKLKEKEVSEIDAREFGIILHDFVAIIVPKLVAEKNNKLQYLDIVKLSDNVFNQVITNDKYEAIYKNNKNYFALKSLQSECVRITEALQNQLSNSDFEPKGYEFYFGKQKGSEIFIEDNHNKVLLTGVVDRFDEYENTFRVIDYKTGQSNFTNFTDVLSGKKIQLLVYVKAMQNYTNKVCVGAFYMPLNNSFDTEDKVDKLFKLRGVVTNELNSIFAMDNNLRQTGYESDILNLKTSSKEGVFDKRVGGNLMLDNRDIEYLADYSIALINKAFKEILQGNIQPNPLVKKLGEEYLDSELVGLNNYNLEYGNKERVVENLREFDKDRFEFELSIVD